MLLYGKAINSAAFEQMTRGEFTPGDFVLLCNTLAWASAGKQCRSLPSFTERVNVKDKGIDTHWYQVSHREDETLPFLGPGWNVFQYKQLDVFAQGRKKAFSDLKSKLKGALSDLYRETQRRPNHYVLFTNIDLAHEQKDQLREQIRVGYDLPESVRVEVVGAAELTPMLNTLPHIRAAFLPTAPFSPWEYTWRDYQARYPFGAAIPLVGRERELSFLRSALDDPKIRVVILSGPQGSGKTRLALHETQHRELQTVIALDPRSVSVGDLLTLETKSTEVLLLLDGPDPEQAEVLVQRALTLTGLKLVMTVPTEEHAPTFHCGLDDRVRVAQVSPLSESHARELLKSAQAPLDFGLESWVIEQAGGNPGILLLAAELGTELRKTPTPLIESMADAVERRIRREFGSAAIEALRLLSVLTYTGVRELPSEELRLLCSLFGGGLQPNAVFNEISRLEKAGIIRISGPYAEVLPPLLANRLALSTLRGRFAELCALFAALEPSARQRFIHRLQALQGEEVARFWRELFGPTGLCKDLASALVDTRILRLLAGVVPD